MAGSQDSGQAAAGQAAWLKAMENQKLREGEVLKDSTGRTIMENPKTHPLHFGQVAGADGTQALQGFNPITAAPVGPARSVGMTPDQTAHRDAEAGWGDPYEQGGALVQSNAVTGQVRQVVARPPQTHVYNPPAVTTTQVIDPKDSTRMLSVDARTYKQGGSLGDVGVIGVSGKLGDAQKLVNKREFNMAGIGKTIKEAEDLLGGEVSPTHSLIGRGLDIAGGAVGYASPAAIKAAELQPVGAALVAKMPRMEGPQSDRDLVQYKEMAGKVGDPTQPLATRKAALEKVKELWAKYENLNPDAFADRRQGGGGSSGGWSVVK